MEKYALLINRDLCFNCKACEVACKQEHDLPVGENWIRVITVGPRKVGNNIVADFFPMTCRHCAQAPCLQNCPTKAITRNGHGVVLIDAALCIGCMVCIEVCPFSAPQFNAAKNVVEKCDLCIHRIDKGLQPACVQHCEAKAILFGEVNKVAQEMREQRSKRMAASGSL